jgi:uncharacterized membrane protein
MNPVHVLLFAFLIGFIAGLRTFVAPAAIAWGAHLSWFYIVETPFAFMASTTAGGIFLWLMIVELFGDKFRSIPKRTNLWPFVARIVSGAFCGAFLAAAGGLDPPLGATFGALGAVAGTFGGYRARTGLVKAIRCPDFVIAILEDAVAIGGALLITTRF